MDDRVTVFAIRAEKDPRVRDQLFSAFIASKETLIRILVEKMARAEKTTAEEEDLMQAGRDGMRRAIEDWDPEKGALSTHAGWWIKNRVQQAARAAQPIALPRIRLTSEERTMVLAALKKNPHVTAAELGVPENVFEQVKASFGLRFLSVDLFGDGDDAPARQRKIERKMSDGAEPDADAEDQFDARASAGRLIEAGRAFMTRARVTVEDAIVFFAHGLGGPTPYAEPMPAKKAQPAAPHSRQPDRVSPWKTSPLSKRNRPRPPLPPRSPRRKKAGALASGKPRRASPLPLRSLPRSPLPSPAPRSRATSVASIEKHRSLKLLRVSAQKTEPKSSPPSASRAA